MPDWRYDCSKGLRLDSIQELPNGHLRIPAVIATCRVDEYNRGGAKVLEARPPEELFSEETMRSFEGVVLSRAPHPRPDPGEQWPVTANNTRRHHVGHTLTCRRDGNDLVTDIIVTDADAIAEIRGGKSKLSPGYRVAFDDTPTELNGERADGTQRQIRGNHVIYLPPGANRQGDTVGFRLDASDGVSVDLGATVEEITIPKEEYAKLKAMAAELEKMKQPASDAEGAPTPPAPAAPAPAAAKEDEETKPAEDSAEYRARVDSLEADNASLRAKLDDSSRMDARIELVANAKSVLGLDWDSSGRSDEQIREAVVLKVQPTLASAVVENREDSGYLRALADQAFELHAKSKNKGKALLSAARSAGRSDSGESALAKARREESEARAARAGE